MNWERIKTFKEENIGSKRHVLKRVYGESQWRDWPRIIIGIFEKGNSINIGVSHKKAADACWENISLPQSLVGELASLLEEYIKLKTPKKTKTISHTSSTLSGDNPVS